MMNILDVHSLIKITFGDKAVSFVLHGKCCLAYSANHINALHSHSYSLERCRIIDRRQNVVENKITITDL